MKRAHLVLPLSVLGTLVAVVATGWFLWQPLIHDLARLRQEQQTSARDTQLAQSRTQALQSLATRQAALEESVERLSGRFATKTQPLPLIQQLETIADQADVDLALSFPDKEPVIPLQSSSTSSAPGQSPIPVPDALASLKSVPVEVKLTGDYEHLVVAMRELEQLVFLGEIRSITFSQPVAQSGVALESLRPAAALTIRFFLAP